MTKRAPVAIVHELLAALGQPTPEPANDDLGIDRAVIEERAMQAAQRMRRARKR